MTRDTHSDTVDGQDELLAHVIPLRHRAADQIQPQVEEPTGEQTPPGENTLWDPSSHVLPRRRNTPQANTRSTPKTKAAEQRSSRRALRIALLGGTVTAAIAAAVALAPVVLHGQAGATQRSGGALVPGPSASGTIVTAPAHTRRIPRPRQVHAAKRHNAPTRPPQRTDPVATPPPVITVSAVVPSSAPAHPPSGGAEHELGFER